MQTSTQPLYMQGANNQSRMMMAGTVAVMAGVAVGLTCMVLQTGKKSR